MWVGGQDGRPRGTPLREEWKGEGDGSPHPRGQRRDGRWGNVRVSVGEGRLLRRRDSSTSLRYAQNDMWVGGQDGRPRGTPLREEWKGEGDGSPHARGQRRGRAGVVSGGRDGQRGDGSPHQDNGRMSVGGGGCYGDEILRLRCATLRMTCGLGVKTGAHEGRPYGRSGRERGMGPRIREDNGGRGVSSWTPAGSGCAGRFFGSGSPKAARPSSQGPWGTAAPLWSPELGGPPRRG